MIAGLQSACRVGLRSEAIAVLISEWMAEFRFERIVDVGSKSILDLISEWMVDFFLDFRCWV